MPAKRRGKAVLIPSSPAYSFGTSQRLKLSAGDAPGPGTYNVHGEALHLSAPRGSKGPQTMARGNVLASTTSQPLSCHRSSPCAPMGLKPFNAGMLTKTLGPGDYDDNKVPTQPRHAAYSFKNACNSNKPNPDPGPGSYKWGPNADKVRPTMAEGVSMKFRRPIPGDKLRKPGPDEYSPKCPLDIYKGEYTKCTLKFSARKKPSDLVPDPGPGEYTPQTSNRPRAPGYTLRLKLASEEGPPPYPAPGHYDEECSTIGNWGAGMAAHIPEHLDGYEGNRKKLLDMRREEHTHCMPDKGAKSRSTMKFTPPESSRSRQTASRGTKGRSTNGQKSQTGSLRACTPLSSSGQVQGSGLLTLHHSQQYV